MIEIVDYKNISGCMGENLMFRKIAILSIILSLFCFQEIVASAQGDVKEQLTIELMKKSGLDHQIVHTPDVLNAAVASNFRRALKTRDKKTNAITDKVKYAISKSFRPEIIKSVISTHMEHELDLEDIKAVLDWLNSPLGRKITQLEEEASTAAAYKAMTVELPALKKKSDYLQRLRLMQELDNSIKATDSTLERELNMQIVSLTAMSSAFPTMSLPSTAALKENFKSYSNTMRQRIATEIMMNSLYTYRALHLDEIQSYITFIKTGYGERYHRVVHEGINKAYLFCGKEFGKNVGKMLAKDSMHDFNRPDIQTYPQRK